MKINRSSTILLFIAMTILSCGDGPVSPLPVDLPRISIGDLTVFEGDTNKAFNFLVNMSKTFEQEVRVDFDTEEVTAGAGIDFLETRGTLVIPPGIQQGAIEVPIVGDTLKEPDEQFRIILSNPVNGELSKSEALGTLRNDDTYIDVPEDGYITPESYVGYDLVWRDEFEASVLNQSDWTYEIGAGGWGNQESQYYTDRLENAFLTDGSLVIEAKEESFQGSPYTSARIITQSKQNFKYGRVDIRAILPEGQGIWPALWMLGQNFSEIGWPACGEIDIMELVGHEPAKVHGTAHWGPQGQTFSHNKGASYTLSGEKYSEKFHVFSIIWEANSITWYVDDEQYFTLTNSDVNGNYPFNDAFFFIFNIAVGGQWPGDPDESTIFPQRMYVDYVRVFQKS